jgi:predicted O-methyltransferase YrrM
MAPDGRDREVLDLILQDLAKSDVPPYSKWLLRKRAGQAVLPFATIDNIA